MADLLTPTAFSTSDADLVDPVRTASGALGSAFGGTLDFWTLEPGTGIWSAVPAGAESPSADRPAMALAEPMESQLRSATEPVLVAQDGTTLRIGLPLGKVGDRRLAATASIEDSRAGLALKLGRLSLGNFYLQQQLRQYRDDMDVCAAQIGSDYEELAFLRKLAEHLDVSEASLGTWHVAETVLPHLAAVIHAESLVLIDASPGSERGEAAGVERPVLWVGHELLGDAACRRFIREFAPNAREQPLVVNHFHEDPRAADFPGVRKFMVVAVARGPRLFGWLVAINHSHQEDCIPDDPLFGLSQFEFGTVEAGLLTSVASTLATHAHNVELFRERESLLLGIVRAMVSAVDAKDPYTCGHSERVAMVARYLARRLGIPEDQCEHVYLAGLLHDLGKLGVPDAVLRKEGRLTEEELDQIRPHPERGWAILQGLDPLKHLVPGILHHHEQYDGAGYPDGLSGEEIPLIARILAVADSYDAMVSDRPYRKGMPQEKVERILREGSGTQWDPRVIDLFLRNAPEIRALWNEYRPPVPRRHRPGKSAESRGQEV